MSLMRSLVLGRYDVEDGQQSLSSFDADVLSNTRDVVSRRTSRMTDTTWFHDRGRDTRVADYASGFSPSASPLR